MTPAEAHVWIAVFAARIDDKYFDADAAASRADSAVDALREKVSERLEELDEALRQGLDTP